MNIFSARSIGLYTVAIGSAIGFFNLVTSYGEANIKAPIAVAGNYLIASQDLPGCLQHKAVLLKLQQSGVYLNASLMTIDVANNSDLQNITDRAATTSSTNLRPTFSGRLHDNRQLDLSGSLPPASCPVPAQLRISGSIVSSSPTDGKLRGQLWLTNKDGVQGSPVNFTAIVQPLAKSSQSH
jgi:hypothetical protein